MPQVPLQSESEPELRLDIDAHVVQQLGDELITDTGQAILELIKNSYDADAGWSKVNVDTDHVEIVKVKIPDKAVNEESSPVRAAPKKETPEYKEVTLRGILSVEDNGTGMTLPAIQNGWLMISLSPKRAFKALGKVTEKYKRTPVGDKGLGRLGTMKLGNYVVIETFTDAKEPGYRVAFFWSDCASGYPLSKVPVSKQELPSRGKKGTTLSIYGLKDLDYWKDEKSISRLEMQLSTLISPFKDFTGFTTELSVNGRPIHTQNAQPYLKHAQSKFELYWLSEENKDGKKVSLEIEGRFKISLFKTKRNDDFYEEHVAADNGVKLFEFFANHKDTIPWDFKLEKKPWYISFKETKSDEDLLLLLDNKYVTDPGPLLAEIYSFDMNEAKEALSHLMKRADAPKFVEDGAGVFVFRDNFRIRMGDDWLGLGKSWTEGSSYYGLKPKNSLGWVAITASDNKQLVEKSDREGFIDNAAKRGFDAITTLFRDEINDSLEVLRRTYLEYKKAIGNQLNNRPSNYTPENALDEIKSAAVLARDLNKQIEDQTQVAVSLKQATQELGKIANESSTNATTKKEIGRLSESLDAVIEKLEKTSDSVPSILNHITGLQHAAETVSSRLQQNSEQFTELYEMSALGLAAQGLIHELQPCIDEMLHSVENIKKIFKLMQVKNPRLFENIELTQVNAKAIGSRVRFLDPMLRTYRSSVETIDILKFLTEFKTFKETTLAGFGIKINLTETGEKLVIRANRGRLTQIFDNLVRNSEYWLRLYAKKQPSDLSINIEISHPFVIINDSGFGVDKKLENLLFDLFVSGKPSGEGHGLGLFLVKELLAEENSEIALMPDRNKHGRRYVFRIDFTGALPK